MRFLTRLTASVCKPIRGGAVALAFLSESLLSFAAAQEASPVPNGKPSTYPAWWFQRGVVARLDMYKDDPIWPDDFSTASDFVAVNQGQLKAIATAAYDEFEANLAGGAGSDIFNLIKQWFEKNTDGTLALQDGKRVPLVTANTQSYAMVNIGQLKSVAKPFYDRLIAAGLRSDYPWQLKITGNNLCAANIGQLKNVFSFTAWVDSDGDGLPDAVEIAWGLNPHNPNDANFRLDGRGLTALEYFWSGSSPTDGGTIDPSRWNGNPPLNLQTVVNADGSSDLYWDGDVSDLETITIRREVPAGEGVTLDWGQRVFEVIDVVPASNYYYHVPPLSH